MALSLVNLSSINQEPISDDSHFSYCVLLNFLQGVLKVLNLVKKELRALKLVYITKGHAKLHEVVQGSWISPTEIDFSLLWISL